MTPPASHTASARAHTDHGCFTVNVAPKCQASLAVVSALLHASVDTCMTAGPDDFDRARELGLMRPASVALTPQGVALLRSLGHTV